MKLFLLPIALLLGIPFASFAQSPPPTFTKQHYYADYDYLVETIQRASPHILPKKKAWQYDILKGINRFRHEIDTISSYESFWELTKKALSYCQDGHTGMHTQSKNYNALLNSFNLDIPIRYVNGEYLVVKPFQYKQTTFPVGTKITQFNGLPVHTYVQSLTPYKVMSWDVKHHQFQNFDFYTTLLTARAGTFTMTMQAPGSGPQRVQFAVQDTVQVLPTAQTARVKKVEFWDDQGILYLKVPSMAPQDTSFYRNEITAKAKNKTVKKVLIDIRNNGGGSDYVWMTIYQTLIDKPVSYPVQFVGNEPSFMTKEYQRRKGIDPAHIKTKKLPFLDDRTFYIYEDSVETLRPNNNSIRFNGKIIVIGNEGIYSSGGSCMALPNASKSDNFISIGRKTGWFLGMGIDPITFTLPNTKIEFQIAPAVDITNANSALDMMQDRYEYEIPYTLEEFTNRLKYTGSIWDQAFLVRYDPFIKKALSL